MLLSPKDQLHTTASGSLFAFDFTFVIISDGHTSQLAKALDAYREVIEALPHRCELVVINCGMPAKDWDAAKATLDNTTLPVTVVTVNQAVNRSAALSVATQHASGEVLVVLPEYLQCVPSAIDQLLEKIGEGYDYVATRRDNRVDGKTERTKSTLFNRAVRLISGLSLNDINSGAKAFRREVIESVPVYGDQHLYLPILAAKQGFRVTEVGIPHREERRNPSDSGFAIYLRRGLDLLTLFFLIRFTQKPFRFFGGIGSGLLGVGLLINSVIAFERVFLSRALADRPMLLLGTLLMVLGINLFSLGLLGELIIFANAGGIKEFQVLEVYRSDRKSDEEDETQETN